MDAQKVIDEVVLYLNATEEFVTEQAPLLAQEIIRHGIWWNLIVALFWSIPLIIIIIIGYKLLIQLAQRYKNCNAEPRVRPYIDGEDTVGLCALIIVVSILLCLYPIIAVCSYTGDGIKALIAPRLYILEEIGKLL